MLTTRRAAPDQGDKHMKYVKMLGLLAVAAAALMAFAGTASATTITSTEGTTPTIEATGGTTELHPGEGASFLTVVCKHSAVKGTVESHGTNVTAKGAVSTLDFSECGNDTVTVLKSGSLEAHASGTTGNGTLTSTGAEVRIHTSEGPVCTVKTSGQSIGTLTGGKEAKLDIGSSNLPMSGFLCPSIGVWTGSYTVTKPSEISLH
jgi:hypothetical protein